MNDNKTYADLLEAPPMPADRAGIFDTRDVQARDAIWAERVRVALGMGRNDVLEEVAALHEKFLGRSAEVDVGYMIDSIRAMKQNSSSKYSTNSTSGAQPAASTTGMQVNDCLVEDATPRGHTLRAASTVELSDEGWKGLVEKAQFILAKYLPPDGTDEKTTIRELLWLLDGPEYRDVLAKQAAQSPVAGRDSVDAMRWRAFRERDRYEDLDVSIFTNEFREDADAIIDAAINSKEG